MDRVNGADYVDIGSGRRGFRDEDLGSGLVGTEVTADWLNGQQEEIMTLIEAAGFVGDATKWNLLFKAVRSQAFNYYQDTGAANAVVITPAVPFESLAKLVGVPLRIKKGVGTNTGAVTCNVSGLGPIAVKTKTAADLVANAWPGAAIDTVIYNGTFFESQNGNLLATLNPDGTIVQTAPFFQAQGASGGATYADGVPSLSTDLTLIGSNFLDAATTLSGGVLTIGPKDAGVWQFSTNLGINTAVAGWTSKVSLVKNSTVNFGYEETNLYGTASSGNVSVSGSVRLAAGDTVKPIMLQNSGAPRGSSSAGNFSGSRSGK